MEVIQKAIRATLLCCIVWAAASLSVAHGQEEFAAAAKALDEGDTASALSEFEAIAASGQVSSALYANLGKVYYQRGNNGQAILAYERALKLAPTNRDIAQSITNIRQELKVRLTDVPDFFLVSAQRTFVQSLSPMMWVMLQILTGILALGGLYLLWFKQEESLPMKWIRIFSIVSALFFLLTFLFSHHANQYRNSQNTAIVMINTTSISQAPDDLSPEMTEVAEGVKVWITDELGDWFKVVLRDKDEGWIKKSEVEVI